MDSPEFPIPNDYDIPTDNVKLIKFVTNSVNDIYKMQESLISRNKLTPGDKKMFLKVSSKIIDVINKNEVVKLGFDLDQKKLTKIIEYKNKLMNTPDNNTAPTGKGGKRRTRRRKASKKSKKSKKSQNKSTRRS